MAYLQVKTLCKYICASDRKPDGHCIDWAQMVSTENFASSCVCVGFLWVLWFSYTAEHLQIGGRLIGDFNVIVNGCLSLNVGPVIHWQTRTMSYSHILDSSSSTLVP